MPGAWCFLPRSRPCAASARLGGAVLVALTGLSGAASGAEAGAASGQSRCTGTVKVAEFGVVADGTTSDTAAMEKAFRVAQGCLDTGKPVNVVLGPGRIVLDRPLSLDATRASVALSGAGAGISVILSRGPGDVVDVRDSIDTTADFRGFAVRRMAGPSPGGVAIVLDNRDGMQSGGKATFEDLSIDGATGDGGFATGIALHSQSIPVVHDVRIVGPYRGASDDGSSGLLIDGYAARRGFSINAKISDDTFQGQWAGLRIGDWVQGVFVENTDILGNTVGVAWSPHRDTATEYLSMSNSHVNTSDYGVRIANTDGLITGCYFLTFRQGNRVWHGVDASDVASLSVTGTVFRTQNGLRSGDTGIRYAGRSAWGNFSSDTFDDFTAAIRLEGSAWATVGNNVYVNNSAGLVDDAKSKATRVSP